MSGLFASLSVGRAWEKLTTFLRVFSTAPSSSSSESQQADLDELRKLERTMHRIRATLHDAEEHWNIREESAKLRLTELKEVAYDIEDVLDEYEYEMNRCKVEALERAAGVNNRNTGKRKHQEEIEAYPMDAGVVAVPRDLVLQARKITERFNEIIHYSEYLGMSDNDGERRFTPDITSLRHTSSVVFEKSILGRDQDKENIIDKLLSREGDNVASPVSVMAIVGMGGLGKTTLAQLVYNSPRVSQSFEKHAWICVSEHFDVKAITRNIIISLIMSECNCTELADLQTTLANEVMDTRVLLVLDDVWNERRDCWELLCTPLTTSKFCQIIVTTRNEEVARLIQTMPFYHLRCLTFDESWSLFSKAACIGEQESAGPTNLIKIGKSIAKRCKGLPLAIKTLGSMLRYQTDESRWEEVLESELWDLKEPRDQVLPALQLSYKHMPTYLKPCFLALSLFPKDLGLQDFGMIRIWKLLDLLYCEGSDDENEIGKLYLNLLVQRSITQVNDASHWKQYHVHDLIHDLACFLAGGEFYRFEGGRSTEIPLTVRYMSAMSVPGHVSYVEIPVTPRPLRAFINVDMGNWRSVSIKNPDAIFQNCQKLRTLDLSQICDVEAFPDSIGSLTLLRHLSFGARGLGFKAPNSIFRLYNLRTLELDLPLYFSLETSLSGIGRLINLHTLPYICAMNRCNIRELRNLVKIRELGMYGLGLSPGCK